MNLMRKAKAWALVGAINLAAFFYYAFIATNNNVEEGWHLLVAILQFLLAGYIYWQGD